MRIKLKINKKIQRAIIYKKKFNHKKNNLRFKKIQMCYRKKK